MIKPIQNWLTRLIGSQARTDVVKKEKPLPKNEVTPQVLKNALTAFLNGDPSLIEPIFNKIALDEHAEGCISSRLSATSGLSLEFSSAEEGSAVDAQRDFLKQVFENIQVDDLIEEILEAKLRLFRVIEPHWEIRDNRLVLSGFNHQDNDLFQFDRDELYIWSGSKRKSFADTPRDSIYAVKVRSKKAILLRCLKPYVLKNFGYESWAHFIEVFSDPFRVGRYPDGAGKEIRDQVWEAVYNLGQDGAAAMPMSAKIEFVENSRTGGQTFGDLVAASEAGLSKAILGHSAAADSTPGKLGNETGAMQVREDLAAADRRFAVRWLYAGFVKPLLTLNFPAPAPLRPVLVKNDILSRAEIREALKLYWDMGGEVDPKQFETFGVRVDENAPPLKRSTDFVF